MGSPSPGGNRGRDQGSGRQEGQELWAGFAVGCGGVKSPALPRPSRQEGQESWAGFAVGCDGVKSPALPRPSRQLQWVAPFPIPPPFLPGEAKSKNTSTREERN